MTTFIGNLGDRRIVREDLEALLREIGTPSKVKLLKQDLGYIDLSFLVLTGINLSGSNLIGSNLIGSNLDKAKLNNAVLIYSHLDGAILNQAEMRGTLLMESHLRNAKLYKAKMQGCDLQKADLRGADLRGAKLLDANIEDADFAGANVRGAYLDDAQKEFLTDKGVLGLDKINIPQRTIVEVNSIASHTLRVTISDNQWLKLKSMADYLGISVDDLAEATLRDALAPSDKVFKETTAQLLNEDAELHRRLA